MTTTKKLSAGAWLSIVTCVLSLAALVAYLINTSAAGYFQNATVSNLVLMVVGAAVLEAAAVGLSMVKGAKKVVDLLTGLCQIAAPALLALAFINLVSARVEGFAFIYFSNADVLLEVQTAANMSSATCAIVNLVLLALSSIAGIVSAFFTLKK